MTIDKSKLFYEINSPAEDVYECIAKLPEARVCRCKISVLGNTWTISAWYTEKEFQHNGVGILTMQNLMEYLYQKTETPKRIEYIWDGSNSYVYDWLEENFGAISKCPLAVQKTQADDDWDSHIYYLNTQKVIDYFNLC